MVLRGLPGYNIGSSMRMIKASPLEMPSHGLNAIPQDMKIFGRLIDSKRMFRYEVGSEVWHARTMRKAGIVQLCKENFEEQENLHCYGFMQDLMIAKSNMRCAIVVLSFLHAHMIQRRHLSFALGKAETIK